MSGTTHASQHVGSRLAHIWVNCGSELIAYVTKGNGDVFFSGTFFNSSSIKALSMYFIILMLPCDLLCHVL